MRADLLKTVVLRLFYKINLLVFGVALSETKVDEKTLKVVNKTEYIK